MKKQMTSKEYVEQREKIISQFERNEIKEDIYHRKLQALYAKRIPLYRKGGDGFVLWAEENIKVNAFIPGTSVQRPTYLADLSREPEPSTGKSWWSFWCWQKEICREALVLGDDNRLKHNLVIFCTERGEGKSFMAVMILLWKFTVFANQRIFLAANSKEQSGFAHREEMDKIIRISPVILALLGGEKNILSKELAIYDSKGLKISFITTVSTFTGVLSNATGFSFSEFFQAKPDAPFFNQIYSSMRNMPNALGVIDSTVSTRDHKLFKLYQQVQEGVKGSESWFFYYKCNPTADVNLYKSPANTQKQLDAFQASTAANPVEFSMFFKNTWESAQAGLFSDIDIEATHYIGADGKIGNHEQVINRLEILNKHKKDEQYVADKGLKLKQRPELQEFDKKSLNSFDKYVPQLNEEEFTISAEVLSNLSDLFDTDWTIGVGLDRSDPLAMASRSSAQTVLTCVAKGLPGSRSNPYLYLDTGNGELSSPEYLHIQCGLYIAKRSTSDELQQVIGDWHDEFNGVESFASDRYGVSDVVGWLVAEGIVDKPEVVQFSTQKQREVFAMLYNVIHYGRFKKPRIYIPGAKEVDIVVEQLKEFSVSYNGRTVKYGSPQKSRLNGVQDDAVDALAMCIYGMRHLGMDQFKAIKVKDFFGTYISPSRY